MAVALLPLTQTQEDVLVFLWSFYLANDQLPPMRTVSKEFGWKSNHAAYCVFQALMRKGYIEHNAVQMFRFSGLFHEEQRRIAAAEEEGEC